MGVKALPRIGERLTAEGRAPAEPAAAIERGTLPGQRTVTGPLAEIAELAADAGVRPPAITVVGPVAARRETIAWLERRPLNAIRVIVTDEVRRAIEDIHAYALICLTSANSVRLLFEAMAGAGRDARALANASVAAIGPGTAAALAEFGVMADLLPERMVAESLVEALEEIDLKGKRVLLARASEAREVLPDALRRLGAELDVVPLYETVAETPAPETAERAAGAGYITFTSASTVRNLVDALGEELPRSARVVSIGPVTSQAVREAGLEVAVGG